MDEGDDDKNWADPGAQSSGWSHQGDGKDNYDGEGEEDTQGGEKLTRKGMGTKKGRGRGKGQGKAMEEGKGKRKGKCKGKGIVEQTPGGDDISRAVALQLQKEMYEAD